MTRTRKISLLTIFILLMSIITSQVYAAKIPFTDVPESLGTMMM